MKTNESKVGEFNLLEVLSYVDVYNCSHLKNAIKSTIELKRGNLAISLTGNQDHIDSSVISAVIFAQKKVTASGSKFALVMDNDDIINLLNLAGLKGFFILVRKKSELEDLDI